MNKNDRKLTESEKLEIYNSFTSSEKRFYGSAEDFCRDIDVYENAAAPWSYYYRSHPRTWSDVLARLSK